MSTSIIRLITPNNKSFKIDLNGEEQEVIELISMITGIPVIDIKGIQDYYGNYYTISSVINNLRFNSDNLETFFLICGSSSELSPLAPFDSRKFNTTPSARRFLNTPGAFNNFKTKSDNNEKNFDFLSTILNHQTARKFKDNFKPSHVEYDSIDENEYKFKSKEFSQNSETVNTRDDKNFLNEIKTILNQLKKINMINENQEISLIKLVNNKNQNEDLINLFKIYSQDIIDKSSFITGLKKILKKCDSNMISLELSPGRKQKLNSLIDNMNKELIQSNEDYKILKNLVDYENINIIKAFELFEEDEDFEKFYSLLMKIIEQRRSPNSLQNSRVPQSILTIKENFTPFSYKKNSLILDKKIEEKILSNLHTEEKIIFKYAIRNKFKEIEILAELFETFKKEEILIKPLKLLCKKFIDENVVQNMGESHKKQFYEFLSARNQNVIEIFKEFKEHYRIEKLEKDIHDFILKQETSRSISTSKNSIDKIQKKNVCVTSSENSDEENSLTENMKETNKIKGETINITEKNSIKEFLNLVNLMNFLKPEEKKEFEASIKKNSPIAIKLVNDYYKTKNILSIKSSLLSMFRKNKNQLNYSVCSSIEKNEKEKEFTKSSPIKLKSNSKKSETKFDTFDKILENLEKSEKISSQQHKFLLMRYENNDEEILSIWEVYKHNNNLNDLIESLMILSKQCQKTSHKKKKFVKSKVSDQGKNKKNFDEKDDLKMKQYNVANLLQKENLIEGEKVKIIYKMIEEENHLLISAFEVFSVTMDLQEFCDTLNIICEEFKNMESKEKNDEQNFNFKLNLISTANNKETNLNQVFKEFINHTKSFNENEKNTLQKLFSNKNEFLLSALEIYEKENDEVDFVDSLKILLKKF